MSRLFVVATPIGNLEDVTVRSLRILKQVSLIAAEDTRTAGVLLNHYDVKNRLISYTDHNKTRRIPEILAQLETADVALVSDAGTPAISDPGVELAAAARDAGHEVVPVPGASAVVAALSAAGMSTLNFRFVGFLPRNAGDLRRLLQQHSASGDTLVAFESPQRLRKSLAVVAEEMPGLRIAVCRELTKLHEEIFVAKAAEALAHFSEPRGEIVLVFEPCEPSLAGDQAGDEAAQQEILTMKSLGLTRSQASALLSQRYGLSRRRLYELWLAADSPS